MSSNYSRRDPQNQSKRGDERFETVMAVRTETGRGSTRDVSATGIYFESDASREVGSIVNFVLEVIVSGETQHLVCEGKVVRIEHLPAGGIGVAAQLRTLYFCGAGHDEVAAVPPVPAALEGEL
ncbi:MAG: PilZ domain-containing protein [Burkholderiaceae bacterium]